MTQAELFALMDRFERSAIMELCYQQQGESVTLRKQTALQQAAAQSPSQTIPAARETVEQPAADVQEGRKICSPLVGTFYAAPAPAEPPFAAVGREVKKGETVCIIEAMKMINEVPAPCDCVIKEVLVKNETLVGFQQPLFYIEEK